MFRALILLGAFSLISPSIRGMFLSVFDIAEKQINLHSTIALVATGILCAASVLWIRLTSHR